MQRLELDNGSECTIIRDVFTHEEGVSIVKGLRESIDWERKPIKVYGKDCWQNRSTAQYGAPGCRYSYSGTTHIGTGSIPSVIQWIEKTGVRRLVDAGVLPSDALFNYFLLNRYADGTENIGEHSDDESGLAGPIVSFSFGASRYFDVRKKSDKSKIRVELHCGDCVVMAGNMQRYYKHGIPVQKKIKEVRYNVTLRRIV